MDVWRFGTEEIAKVLASQPEDIALVIKEIAAGHQSRYVLEAVLSLPAEQLMRVHDELIALLSSELAIIRRIIIRTLATARWLSKEEAMALAQAGLTDEDTRVRDRAIFTLRTLESDKRK